MNVYTHYKTIDNYNVGYRWRTLLQFGSSWDVIGSVVMKNPGSANYKYGKDCWIECKDTLAHLESFDYPQDKGEKWYEFNADQTMQCIADLFVQYMNVPSKNDLQGVVQIFNLFYLRDPNLGDALKKNQELSKFKQINDEIFEQDIQALIAPVYLGFGSLYRMKNFQEKAIRFFDEAKNRHNALYLDPIFENNRFTHPMRLMRYIKNKPQGIVERMRFCSNCLTSPEIDEAASNPPTVESNSSRSKLQSDLLKEIASEVGKQLVSLGYSQISGNNERYIITKDLLVSVTFKNNGQIAFRHINFDPKNQQYGHSKYSKEDDCIKILQDNGYKTSNVWLGTKQIHQFGSSKEQIVQNIIHEIEQLSIQLK